MRDEVSNAEVDRILQEIQQKQTAQAVSNQLVDQVLQSIQAAGGNTVNRVQEQPPSSVSKQPTPPRKPKKVPQKPKVENSPSLQKKVEKEQIEKKQQPPFSDGTQEFELSLRLDDEQPNAKGLVVDERFRDFFTQTALEVEPQPFLQSKKEKKPSLRQRLQQVKEEQEAKRRAKELQLQEEVEPTTELQQSLQFAIEKKLEQETKTFAFPQERELPVSPERRYFDVKIQPEPEEQTGEFSIPVEQPIWQIETQEPEPEKNIESEDLEEKTTILESQQESLKIDQEELEQESFVEEKKQKKKFFGLRLFGTQEDDEESEQEEQEPEDDENQADGEIEEDQTEPVAEEDILQINDTEEIQDILLAMSTKSMTKTIITALLSGLLLWLGMGASRWYALPPVIDPAIEPLPFLVVNLVLLALALLMCLDTIKDGVLGFFHKPSMDSLPTLAILGAFVQIVVLVLYPKKYEPATFTLFSGIAVACLSLNLLGKRIQNRVVSKNFEIANSQLEHWAACTVTERERVATIAKDMEEPNPRLLVSRPTGLVEDFLKQSYSLRKSEKNARKLSYMLLITALVSAIVGGWVAGSWIVGTSVFAAAVCLGAPFANTLLYAVPSLLMQKHTSRVGAVVPGWTAIEELGKTNMVLVGAKDIFPVGTISLKGIKTFEKERIDLAILYATSILVEGSDTMKEIFSQLIQGKTDILYPVESFTHEIGCGYSAWINDERVLIGTREMMLRHGLTPPSEEWEARCSGDGNRQLLYLAVSGKLFGVFGIEYQSDKTAKQTLDSLVKRGISILIKSDDCCLTEELVAEIYEIPVESIKILNQQERKILGPELIFRPQSQGIMTHLGSFASFIGGLKAAETAAAGEQLATIVQTASVIFSCIITIALAVSGGLISLALPAVLLYQASWTVLQLAMPLSKQY